MKTLNILALHGPNLNLLGRREPERYGVTTLAAIERGLVAQAATLHAQLTSFQSNHEGALVERLQACLDDGTDGIIMNLAALTHTSVALRDALIIASCPAVEVHISNVFAREPFRHRSLVADICLGHVAGFGPDSYRLALDGLVAHLRRLEP